MPIDTAGRGGCVDVLGQGTEAGIEDQGGRRLRAIVPGFDRDLHRERRAGGGAGVTTPALAGVARMPCGRRKGGGGDHGCRGPPRGGRGDAGPAGVGAGGIGQAAVPAGHSAPMISRSVRRLWGWSGSRPGLCSGRVFLFPKRRRAGGRI